VRRCDALLVHSRAVSAAQGELSPGARVDRYEIIGHLGGGGFGVVYAARHTHLNQTVALKLLRPDLAGSAEAVERFFREARAAAALGNPHIVEILDCGMTHTQQHFISMELLEGLGAAHGAGITHRDLKPANIFLCRGAPGVEGDFVKILDFGASKVQAHALQKALTATGAWIGTPAYMSPEQFLGARDVDHRADLYAVSVVLYEMLADTLPVLASTAAEMATRVLSSPPRALAEHRPELPSALCAIVERGLAKDPEARYPDAASYAAALREAGGIGPAEARAEWMLRSTQASQPEVTPPPPSTGGGAAAVAASGVVAAAPSVAPPMEGPAGGAPAVAPGTPPPLAAGALVPAPAAAPVVLQGQVSTAPPAPAPAPLRRYFVLVAAIALVGGMLGGGIVSGTIALVTSLAGDGDTSPPASGGEVITTPAAAWTPQIHSGTIAQPGQAARYPLHVTSGRTFTIFVQGQGLDPTVRVVDSRGTQLGFDDDGGGGLNSRLILLLQPGDYFVEVSGFSSSTGSFTCNIN